MYTRLRAAFVFAALAMLAAPLCAQTKASAAKQAGTAKLKWGPPPPVFAPGAKFAVVSGDPGKPGPYVVQLAMPNLYQIAPHFHPTAENVLVKSGLFGYGMGDTLRKSYMKALKAGEKTTFAPNMHHFAMARGETVVEVSGTGPFKLTYVNPADDPSKKK